MVYYSLYGHKYSLENLLLHLNSLQGVSYKALLGSDNNELPETNKQVLYPYIGFVFDSNYLQHGFKTNNSPIQEKSGDKLIVAVVGGSFAQGITPYIEGEFQKYFKKKNIKAKPVVIGMAISGYKQPQQLLAISYFLSLGTEFDIVINKETIYRDMCCPEKGTLFWLDI
jgi:hypothetical protein